MSVTPETDVTDKAAVQAAIDEKIEPDLEALYAHDDTGDNDEEDSRVTVDLKAELQKADDAAPEAQKPAEDVESDSEDETEQPTETSEETAEDAEDVTPTEDIGDELLARATAIGFTDDEAKTFASPEHLDRAIRAIDRRLMELGQQKRPPTEPASTAPTLPTAPPKPTAPAPPKAPAPSAYEISEALRKDGEYDEAITAEFGRLGQWAAQQVAEVREALSKQTERVSAHQRVIDGITKQQEAVYEQQMNGLWDGLEEPFAEVFGKGPTKTLGPNSDHANARGQIEQDMVSLALGILASGNKMSMPELPELHRRAVLARHGDVLKKTALTELSDSLKKRSKQLTNRPTHRTAERLSDREQALRDADKMWKEKQLGPQAAPEEEF